MERYTDVPFEYILSLSGPCIQRVECQQDSHAWAPPTHRPAQLALPTLRRAPGGGTQRAASGAVMCF